MTTPETATAADMVIAMDGLPAGLTARPLTPTDASAVVAVIAAQELDDIGEVLIEEADIVSEWQRPSFDLASSSVGVFDGDRLVGYAEFSTPDRGDAAVHPGSRGRGIGTWLAHRMQELARAKGATEVGMPVPLDSPGDRLLQSLGYRLRWTSWALELPAGARIPDRQLPEGFAIRTAREDEYRAVWKVVEDAFLEWSRRERQSFEDFSATVVQRPGFEPWNLRVCLDPAGDVGGVAFVNVNEASAFISRLATRADLRGRGLAQCLLVDAFAAAREHGCTRSELSTDSRTGALGLYEKVGMVVTSTWVNRGITI